MRGSRLLLGLFVVLPLAARADGTTLSADRLNMLDQRGYFTPAFKTSVKELVDTRKAVAQARADEQKLEAQLPALQQQQASTEADVARLRKELALYAHPEDADYDELQRAMNDPKATPQEQLALAQAFVWSYPSDPHQAEAVHDVQRIQQEFLVAQQNEKNAEASRAATQAELLRRVRAKSLSLAEWQDFLRDRSQEELLSYLGRPQTQGDGYWIYTGDWTVDPVTQQKVGLRIDFNGTRVLSVAAAPPNP